jgi:hypothetical protein
LEDEMGRAFSTLGGDEKCVKSFVGKRTLGRTRHRWEGRENGS